MKTIKKIGLALMAALLLLVFSGCMQSVTKQSVQDKSKKGYQPPPHNRR